MKRNSMTQWINHWNNIFVNQTRLPLLCEKSGATLLVSVGLTVGRQAVRRNTGRLKKNLNYLQIASVGFLWSLTKVHCYHRVTNGFQLVFYVKCIVRHVIKVCKSGTTCFSCQSLLLSTTVLNDIDTITMYITVFTAILLIFCHLGVAMKPYLMQTLRLSLCNSLYLYRRC